MRTTLTLDEDVAEKTKELAIELGKPFKTVVNDVLRMGLEHVQKPASKRSFSTDPHPMGIRKGLSLDNIADLLAQVEGEQYR